MLIAIIHNRRGKKNAPTGDVCRGKGFDDPFRGRGKGVIEEEEVEMDKSLDDDNTFIEEQEEEDADVTDIIGGDIENNEEG